MTRYHFHATDGYSAVFDRTGWRINGMEFDEVAAVVADAVRRRFGALADLSDWAIEVYADNGDWVTSLPFAELSRVERALAA